MTTQTRRERERADRRQLIVDTARELAESQGWDAVTVRKLAERIEYSQPVLYSHFSGKVAIVSAVAEEGFAELALVMRRAREGVNNPRHALSLAAQAYIDFAVNKPALYDAMFVMKTELAFGPDASESLKDAFGEFLALFAPFTSEGNLETHTEVAWCALHGLATLDRGHRLRPDYRNQRLALLIDQWAPD